MFNLKKTVVSLVSYAFKVFNDLVSGWKVDCSVVVILFTMRGKRIIKVVQIIYRKPNRVHWPNLVPDWELAIWMS